MLKGRIIILIVAFFLDMLFGDPRWLYHPVCAIGNLIHVLTEYYLKKCDKNRRLEKGCGFIMVMIVLIISIGLPAIVLYLAYQVHLYLGMALECFWCYQLLAARCLRDESTRVEKALKVSLEEGRNAVAMIVGRDTKELSEEGVIKATVETIAENTSDGEIAPLFYMTLFGAVGGFFYKAVNTMDSMVGYHNEKYEAFGFAAAKLDDICNFIPARLSAICMMIASIFCQIDSHFHAGNAVKIWRRDRKNHKSPNSAQTESVCAGALGVQLAGPASYFGEVHDKPYIGDATREIERVDIKRANILMLVTSFIFWKLCVTMLCLIVIY